MGCFPCRNAEPEPQFSINREQKQNKEVISNSLNNFQSLLDMKLPDFGDYVPENDFKTTIPKEYQDYMLNNPLKIDPKYNKGSHIYDAKPIKFNNGNIYEGKWNKELRMDGPGKYYLTNDKILAEGNWDNGECKYARIFQPNGDIYEGELKDSMYNGKGKLITTNNEIYEGDFKDGEKCGKGKMTFSDGTIFEGNFEKGEFKGEGEMTWKNGTKYKGTFNGSVLNGKGVLENENGDKYDGDFENNLFHGNGKYIFGKTKNVYSGEFQYGKRKGKGKYIIGDHYIFDGNWDNNLPNGTGIITNLKGNGKLKSIWRFGKKVEEPIYESGNEEDFSSIDLDFESEEIGLNPKELPHLESIDNDFTQYRIGDIPSFLDD